MATTLPPLSPPFNTPALNDDGMHSDLWGAHHQELVDRQQLLLDTMHKGVTDGSDAAAGDVGEYLTGTGSVTLVSGAVTNVCSLSLTAGDWDVSGSVGLTTTAGMTLMQAWVSQISATPADVGRFIIGVGGGTVAFTVGRLLAGPARFSLSGAATVYLGTAAQFAAGTVTASGLMAARRAR